MSAQQEKKTILLDPFPATGHVNAFIRVADFLLRRGFRCVFVGAPQFQELVRPTAHEYYIVDPFVLKHEQSRRKERGWIIYLFECVSGRRRNVLTEELRENQDRYERMITEVQPNLILLDDHYSTKALFYDRFRRPIMRLFTMVNPFRDKDVPPFQSSHVPNGSWKSRKIIAGLWFLIGLRRRLSTVIEQLVTCGLTNVAFLRQNFPNADFTFENGRCFALGIQELPMVVLRPRVFDFPRSTERKVYYFYESPPPTAELVHPRLQGFLECALGRRIVYCSLGTVTSEFTKRTALFFNKLLQAAQSLSDIQFIFSLGADYDLGRLGQVPSNVALFKHVPQKELLSHVDIMITHGGLNSVVECLQSDTAMLLYPVTKKWDQPGNGARVAYHGMGFVHDLRRATAKELVEHIREANSELPLLQKNIRQFRKLLVHEAREDRQEFIKHLIYNIDDKPYEILERKAQ